MSNNETTGESINPEGNGAECVDSEKPIYKLVRKIREAVAEYDLSDDHQWGHNGVTDHDCIRCRALEATGANPLMLRPEFNRKN